MNVYVETNFVLELVFQQEQSDNCEQILLLGERKAIELLLPAYCLAEPYEKLRRQSNRRGELSRALNEELRLLARTAAYARQIERLLEVDRLLEESNQEERQRYNQYLEQLLQSASIIPLSADILKTALHAEARFDLRPQDAIVLASVLDHLSLASADTKCFLNRNARDFGNPNIVQELNRYNCRMIPRFDDGYRFIASRR